MANASSHITINLSRKPKDKFETVFYKWAINSGKVIIIITELIALGAFCYRFVIDKQIADLHDEIKREQVFLDNQKSKEKEYRGIQDRLSIIQGVSTETQAKLSIMNMILSQNSLTFPELNLTVSKNTIGISGSSLSIFSLNNFINVLKKQPSIDSISLDQLATTTQGIEFKMNIGLKEKSL